MVFDIWVVRTENIYLYKFKGFLMVNSMGNGALKHVTFAIKYNSKTTMRDFKDRPQRRRRFKITMGAQIAQYLILFVFNENML